MKKTLYLILTLLIGITLLSVVSCEDKDDDKELTAQEKLIATWIADSTQGSLGTLGETFAFVTTGWSSYSLTFSDDNTFSATGDNAVGTDGNITYSGTYTVLPDLSPMQVHLTVTISNNAYFPTAAASQPLQQSIFEFVSDDELRIEHGAPSFGEAFNTPSSFTAGNLLIKQ